MFSFTRLFVAITAASTLINALAIPRAAYAVPALPPSNSDSTAVTVDLSATTTDDSTITDAISAVSQKVSTPPDAEPEHLTTETVISAVDGEITNADLVNITTLANDGTVTADIQATPVRRSVSRDDFHEVFAGTGTGEGDRDCAVEGTAYLTYKLVSNSTYSVNDCLDYCAGVDGCVFANLYYEFNNPLLDFVFSEKSNLKCVLFADFHPASEKTNCGGQQQQPKPAGKTYIQQSSGYALASFPEPTVPEGFELVFGPTGGANNAPGYMGFVLLSKYDPSACAKACNERGADPVGGQCEYFNIWRAEINGEAESYTCSMYFLVADESTAVNYGQGDLKVTQSRGYARIALIQDGGFESFDNLPCHTSDFCYGTETPYWIGTSTGTGTDDATFFSYAPYAHLGKGVGLLGSATGRDNLPGTITPKKPLSTVAGKKYKLSFFYAANFSQGSLGAHMDVLWNGQTVFSVPKNYIDWTLFEVEVTASGNDILAFFGGGSPGYGWVDDVKMVQV